MPSTAQSPAASITAAQIPTKPKLAKHHAPAASASEGILKWADLPPVERDKLPKLHWGGGMYSPDPSARMVIINEQVMREGDALGAGLVLERIEAKALVLNRKGQRIRWDIGRE